MITMTQAPNADRRLEEREPVVELLELRQLWHRTELVLRKRALVFCILVGILLVFVYVGLFGVANVTMATLDGETPRAVWPVFARFMAVPLLIGGCGGLAYMSWIVLHHEKRLGRRRAAYRSSVSERWRESAEADGRWQALVVSNRWWVAPYALFVVLGLVGFLV